MKRIIAGSLGLALAVAGAGHARAQDAAADGKYVSKEEFLKLQRENEQLKKEMEEMRAFKAQMQQMMKDHPTATAPAGKDAAGTGTGDAKAAGDAKEMASYTFPGTSKFLFTGYGEASFSALRHSDHAFGAQFNPMMLWKISDRLLFEGELEFELEDSETSTALEIANLSYLVNDYVTFGAGKFLNPMNSFVERFHMAWVNRLPDKPLAVYDGLLPETYVGAQMRGGVPLGSTKFNYSLFVGNAPKLITSVGPDDDASSLGTMEWDNFSNEGGRVAVGGHVGFLPIPELELGYGLHYSGLGGSDEDATLHSVDLNYVRDSELLRGLVRFNAQWVWSRLGKGTYDNNGTPVTFTNDREGGYVQLAYRPTKAGGDLLRRMEPVVRYDLLNQDKTPTGYNEQRVTFGLNYWLTPMTVFKVAYQLDDRNNHESSASGVLVQFATGF